MLNNFTFDHSADDVPQARVLLKQIFAGLELRTRLERKHPSDERPTIVVDHPFTLQNVGNIGHPGPRRNVDDLVLLQRARRLDLLLAVNVDAANADHQDQYDGEDSVAEHDEWIARTRRAPRRWRNLFGLQRSARTPW